MRSRRMFAAIAMTGALLMAALPAQATTSGAPPAAVSPTPAATAASATTTAPATTATTAIDSHTVGDVVGLRIGCSDPRGHLGREVHPGHVPDAGTTKRRATEKVRKGQAQITLPAGSSAIRVRARATPELTASPWVEVSPAPDPTPSPGATYWVSPSSKILGKLARYKSVNKNTRAYYLIRSYMQKFEAAGGGR